MWMDAYSLQVLIRDELREAQDRAAKRELLRAVPRARPPWMRWLEAGAAVVGSWLARGRRAATAHETPRPLAVRAVGSAGRPTWIDEVFLVLVLALVVTGRRG